MKTALVCIAKNEDAYIDEWICYHTQLGFDEIFIYQNNWRYSGNKNNYKNVNWIEFDGNIKQLEAYHNFIKYHNQNFDWAAFFDVDEFLVLDNVSVLQNWLSNFSDYYAIGINWRLFGDNGIKEVQTYSCINRFIRADKELNQHIKTIINLKKCKEDKKIDQLKFCDPHSLKNSLTTDFTISSDKANFIHGPFNKNSKAKDQLNHYYCKTFSEFVNIKQKRGYPDAIGTFSKTECFNINNKNDIIDIRAYNRFSNNSIYLWSNYNCDIIDINDIDINALHVFINSSVPLIKHENIFNNTNKLLFLRQIDNTLNFHGKDIALKLNQKIAIIYGVQDFIYDSVLLLKANKTNLSIDKKIQLSNYKILNDNNTIHGRSTGFLAYSILTKLFPNKKIILVNFNRKINGKYINDYYQTWHNIDEEEQYFDKMNIAKLNIG